LLFFEDLPFLFKIAMRQTNFLTLACLPSECVDLRRVRRAMTPMRHVMSSVAFVLLPLANHFLPAQQKQKQQQLARREECEASTQIYFIGENHPSEPKTMLEKRSNRKIVSVSLIPELFAGQPHPHEKPVL